MGDKLINQLLLASALAIDIYLEIHGKPVPATVGLLAGFCVRHLIADKPEVKP